VDAIDRITGRAQRGVSTGDIYLGTLPFVAVQVLVMALVIAFPVLVLGSLDPPPAPMAEAALEQRMREMAEAARVSDKPDPSLRLQQ
jgi:hypothetical protein